jgi:hypothetical protein
MQAGHCRQRLLLLLLGCAAAAEGSAQRPMLRSYAFSKI